jgi:hypothetical protein
MQQRIFTIAHRRLFCWIDDWHGLTLQEVREVQKQLQTALSQVIFLTL